MADSKITQLPLSPYALDKDLMVVVTGHLEEGSYPQNAKMPLSYIRRYVVRLNLISNAVSGIDTYYNSGLNILTSWTTGIHAIPGNNIEVQFDSGTPASDLYGGTGPICHSGIISTTGLNAYEQNLIKIDYDSMWPHSGGISQTGLNTIKGNLVDIVFSTGSAAAQAMHDRDGNWDNLFTTGNLGEPHHSGIISFTGVNFTTENNIELDLNSVWPHSGQVYNTKINAIKGNLIDIAYDADSLASSGMNARNGPWYDGFNSGIHIADKYYSGILSITGVNAVTENNIVKEYQNIWPYTGIYYNTGINAIAGNRIDITYDETNKYKIATLATTGLNIIAGDGIVYTIEDQYPHRYILSSISTAKVPTGEAVRAYSSANGRNTTIAEILYDTSYTESIDGPIDLMVTAGFKVVSINANKTPRTPRSGENLNSLKFFELEPFWPRENENDYTLVRKQTSKLSEINGTYIVHFDDLGKFFDSDLTEPLSGNLLSIGIGGTGTTYLAQNISMPITFTDFNFSNSYDSNYQEIYRSGKYPYSINELDPMYITDRITLNLTGVGNQYAERNWPKLRARWNNDTDYERTYFVHMPTQLTYTNELDLDTEYPDYGYTGIYPLQTGEDYTYFYEFFYSSGTVKLLVSAGPDIVLLDTNRFLPPVEFFDAGGFSLGFSFDYDYINFTTSEYVTGIQEIIRSSGWELNSERYHGWWHTSLRTQALSPPTSIVISGTYNSNADILCTSIKAEQIIS